MYLTRSSDHISIIVASRASFLYAFFISRSAMPPRILMASLIFINAGSCVLEKNEGPFASIGMTIMWTLDLVMLAMGIVLFTAGVAYVAACDRL